MTGRLIVIDKSHYVRAQGQVYSPRGVTLHYEYWNEVRKVFPQIVVMARSSEGSADGLERLSGPGLRFVSLGSWRGPLQLAKSLPTVLSCLRHEIKPHRAVTVVGGGLVAMVALPVLMARKEAYGAQIVGNDHDAVTNFVGGIAGNMFGRVAKTVSAKLRKRASCRLYVSRSLQEELGDADDVPCFFASNVVLKSDAFAEPRVWAHSPKPLRLICVGRLSYEKGQDVLLKALSEIPSGNSWSLDLVGGGPAEGSLQSMARDLGLAQKVIFHGHINDIGRVRDLLDQSDVFVLPSRTEGMSRALLEAMARALPCLSADVGGARELLQDDEIFAPDDTSGLADLLIKYCDSSASLERTSRRNLTTARKWAFEVVSKARVEYFSYLKSVCG